MKFITYNDSPGGVYQSQVIDVCSFLQTTFDIQVELVAFVSLRSYFEERKKIKQSYKNSTILPAYPGIENWRKNKYILRFFIFFRKRDAAIARGVFSTLLALDCKKISSVCFDARGASAAEWKEYLSKESQVIEAEMKNLEKEAIERADFKIAVSEKLVNYWKENYGYAKSNHVIIPCTINTASASQSINEDGISETRKQLGLSDSDILLVFSGSSAGWQSMNDLYQLLRTAFIENASLKLLVLSKNNPPADFMKEFPNRVIIKWVEPEKVPEFLRSADYGLLYREDSVTNQVSSPVKFGEYLAAGLPVIISTNVGDYSSFVKEKNCGFLFDSIDWSKLKQQSLQEKKQVQGIAIKYLTKPAFADRYKQVVGINNTIK